MIRNHYDNIRKTLPKAERVRIGNVSRVGVYDVPVGRSVFQLGSLSTVVDQHRQQLSDAMYSIDRNLRNDMNQDFGTYLASVMVKTRYTSPGKPDYYNMDGFTVTAPNGYEGLRSAIESKIKGYSTLRDPNAESSDNGATLDIVSVNVGIYTSPLSGGITHLQQGTFELAPNFIAVEPPKNMKAKDRGTKNNCFFRCLRHIFHKHIEIDPVKLRSKFGLSPFCMVPIHTALRIAEYLGIDLTIQHWSNDCELPEHRTNTINAIYKDITILFHEDMDHYFLPYKDVIPKGKHRLMRYKCYKCNVEEHYSNYDAHRREHEEAEKRLLEARRQMYSEPIIHQGEDESYEDFSQRYTAYYTTQIREFIERRKEQILVKEILWLAGPGGCGKSDVLEHLPDLRIMRIAPTGKAADLIQGETMSRYVTSKSLLEQANTYDLIVIDEIGMIKSSHLNQLDKQLRIHCKKDYLFGGIPVIFMGDFLQLPPFDNIHRNFIDWSFKSTLFKHYVVPIPMTYGWRYLTKDQPYIGVDFFNFLMELRYGVFNESSFRKVQWGGVLTRKQWSEMKDRPTALCLYNTDVNALQMLANSKDGTMDIEIPTRIYLLKKMPFRGVTPESIVSSQMNIALNTHGYIYLDQECTHHEVKENPLSSRYDYQYESSVYTGSNLRFNQELLITTNYCGESEEDKRTLRNGHIVYFQHVDDDERLVVKYIDKNKQESFHTIKRIVRYVKHKDECTVVYGYPFQLSSAMTVHKAQGSSLSKSAFLIPKLVHGEPAHIIYVALSRSRDPRNCYFIVDDTPRTDPVKHIYNTLTSKPRLLKVHQAAVDIMSSAEKCSSGTEFVVPIEEFDESEVSTYNKKLDFTSTGTRMWCPTIPSTYGTGYDHVDIKAEHNNLFKNLLFLDVETAAVEDMTMDESFYDRTGTWACKNTEDKTRNQQKFLQDWYFVGTIYIRNGSPVVCNRHPFLVEFAKYQDEETGILYIQRGEYDDKDFCKREFFRFMLACCRCFDGELYDIRNIHRNSRIAQRDLKPISVVGFNLSGFDILGVVQQFISSNEWLEYGYKLQITPKSSVKFNNISITKKKNKLLEIHDLMELVGGSLKSSHKTYVMPHQRDTFIDEIKKRTESRQLVDLLIHGMDVGKGEFPHILTQRVGYKFALIDRQVKLEISDFPKQYHQEISQDSSLLVMNPYKDIRKYMLGDICTTLATYVGIDINTIGAMKLSALKIYTTQQLTSYRSLIEESKKIGKLSSTYVTSVTKNEKGTVIQTNLPLLTHDDNEFVKRSIYGGKTIPRIFTFESSDPEDYFFQGDESGMYSAVMQNCPLPHGEFRRCHDDPDVQRLVYEQWNQAKKKNDPDWLRLIPPGSVFPCPFIATVTVKYPSLVVEPCVPYKVSILPKDTESLQPSENYELMWDISMDMEGVRTQEVTNVDLGNMMADGATLLKVTDVGYFSRYGTIFKDYITTLNTEKYDKENPQKKPFAKLCANALYGATLKQTKPDIHVIIPKIDMELTSSMEKLNLRQSFMYYHEKSKKIYLRGKKNADESKYSQRPSAIGAFVLSWSRTHYQNLVLKAYDDFHNPDPIFTSTSEMKNHLLNQILYTDTDSGYLHKTHMERILRYDEDQPMEKKIMYQAGMSNNPIDQLGKFTDEPSECLPRGVYKPDFSNGNYVKCVRFATIAPKTYTAKYVYGEHTIYKSRAKGVPKNARLFLIPKHEHAQVPDYFKDMQIFMNNSSKDTHDLLFFAFSNFSDFAVASERDGSLKKSTVNVKVYDFTKTDPSHYVQDTPYDLFASNLDRTIGNTRYQKRRLLNDQEATFLGICPIDQYRVTVPLHWNYDGLLYALFKDDDYIHLDQYHQELSLDDILEEEF